MSRAQRNETELDAVFAALADPTRRGIIVRLAGGPATVGELAEPFAMSLPAVSKHIRVLEDAGLLRRARDGRVHRLSLDARPLAGASAFIDHTRCFWEESLEQLARYLEDE